MGPAGSQPIERRRGVLAGFQRHIFQKKALVEEAAGGVVVIDRDLDPGEPEIGRGLVEHREGDAALLEGMNIGDPDLLEIGRDSRARRAGQPEQSQQTQQNGKHD
jgi:hypothetical protein